MTAAPRPRHAAGTRLWARRHVGWALASLLSLSVVTLVPVPAAAAADVADYDFNGDGYADLAVGIPGEQLGSVYEAGSVEVIYGSATAGLRSTGSQAWNKSSAGVKGVATIYDAFGTSTTSGDFDGDGYADLAIGAVGNRYGSVTVLYGSRAGLTARDQLLVSADVGHADWWGRSLRTGDFNGDGRADLAIRADAAGRSEPDPFGVLQVLYGSASGITTAGATRWTKDTAGIAGDSEAWDGFGSELATGDINGDGRDDLAAGYQGNEGGHSGADVFYGSATGLTVTGNQHFDAATSGLIPAEYFVGELGSSVALGDFDADGHDDLVLGDYEGGPRSSAQCNKSGGCPGAVLVLRGSANGVSLTGRRLWSQDSAGVPGTGEVGDTFAWTLATGDLDADGHADLAIGVPGEDLGVAPYDAGAVTVIYGSPTGLTGKGAQTWTQDSPGVKGRGERSDYFGRYLRIADFGHGRGADLAAAGDGESLGSILYAGEVNVLYGSRDGLTNTDQLWSQDTPGIEGKAQSPDFFGVM